MDLIYLKVDFHCLENNTRHHTDDITTEELIVRRGHYFLLTLDLPGPFNPDTDLLSFTVLTGSRASEELGTRSLFATSESHVIRSPNAKAGWRAGLHDTGSPATGRLTLTVTPPADTPVGKYFLSVQKGSKEVTLGHLVVLFNPWCQEDWVHLPDEEEKKEYVLNEQGVIFKGTDNYITSMAWDYGQFEEGMVDICFKMLDVNPKHFRDPADDVSARCNPIYVSRVVSAMINSSDDSGVLVGNWGKPDHRGNSPSYWNGSVDILERWRRFGCHPVRYGQCWVFAGVMCTVMRCLGIPCRVVSNYQSAHDTDNSLTVDVFHCDYGVRYKESSDSIWNFHVWVEAWMRRPDLDEKGQYDGWQVLDPTPQEKSEGVFCCGPSSVKAIFNGHINMKYDMPFVFAEVNADVVYWLIISNGPRQQLEHADTVRVGQNISTKSIGSNKRQNITNTYKHREGTEKERKAFMHAITRDYIKDGLFRPRVRYVPEDPGVEESRENGEDIEENTEENAEENSAAAQPVAMKVAMKIEEASPLVSCQDIQLKLTLTSGDQVARHLSLRITAQTMLYIGIPAANILTEIVEHTLQPGQALSVPVVIPFPVYREHLLTSDSVIVSVVATDQDNPKLVYLTERNIVLPDPPISITVNGEAWLHQELEVDVVFSNPLQEDLRRCSFTLTGSGLLRHTVEESLPDLPANCRIRLTLGFVPYRVGLKTLMVDFDCSVFKNVKSSTTIDVKRV